MVKRDKLGFMNSPNNYEYIKCESIKRFFQSIKLNKNIIKIDTQGYDEIIFQEIPKNILKKKSNDDHRNNSFKWKKNKFYEI